MWNEEGKPIWKWAFRSLIVTLGALQLLAACVLVGHFRYRPNRPRAWTGGTMWCMKRRVIRFAEAHGHLPASMDELPEIPGFDNSLRDAWGRRIAMSINGTQVTFTSLGRDNQPGGEGDDADMIGIFETSRREGGWEDEFVRWLQNPQH
jgi:hypothetical protein